MKKLFIKLARLLGFEIIDQNNFSSPTLKKELNEDLAILNEKSIVLPLGEVKITRKISSILIIVRMNTEIEIWDQSKKRLFEQPKIEYSVRSINSLINSIDFCKNKYPNLKIKTIIIDDHSKDENLNRIKKTGIPATTTLRSNQKRHIVLTYQLVLIIRPDSVLTFEVHEASSFYMDHSNQSIHR